MRIGSPTALHRLARRAPFDMPQSRSILAGLGTPQNLRLNVTSCVLTIAFK